MPFRKGTNLTAQSIVGHRQAIAIHSNVAKKCSTSYVAGMAPSQISTNSSLGFPVEMLLVMPSVCYLDHHVRLRVLSGLFCDERPYWILLPDLGSGDVLAAIFVIAILY